MKIQDSREVMLFIQSQIFNNEDQLEPRSFLLNINKWDYLFKNDDNPVMTA